jgi:hypothetical protein
MVDKLGETVIANVVGKIYPTDFKTEILRYFSSIQGRFFASAMPIAIETDNIVVGGHA